MGHRANLVLVNEDGYELFYCHWCSKDIPVDVFWGPQYTLPYIRQQKVVAPDHWMNHVWAEGGVLLDPRKQALLLYGGEDLALSIPLKRLYLELLRIVWAGWDVRWAHDGIADLGAYVGRDRRAARSEDEPPTPDGHELDAPQQQKYINLVGSFVLEDRQTRLFALGSLRASETLCYGPSLIDTARTARSYDRLPLHRWLAASDFPLGGFHIDLPQKRLLYWSADDPGSREVIADYWPGWTVEWLYDNYEAHLALLDGRVRFPQPETDEVLGGLEKILLRAPFDHVNMVLNMVDDLTQQGRVFDINSDALREDPLDITPARRRAIFDQAVAQWRAGRGE